MGQFWIRRRCFGLSYRFVIIITVSEISSGWIYWVTFSEISVEWPKNVIIKWNSETESAFVAPRRNHSAIFTNNVWSISLISEVNALLKELNIIVTTFCLSKHAPVGNLILISFFFQFERYVRKCTLWRHTQTYPQLCDANNRITF